MKSIEVKKEFIRLRSQGLSLEKICQELNTSRPTLSKWEKELRPIIDREVFLNYETLLFENELLRDWEIRSLIDTLKRAKDELKTRSFEDMPSDKLFTFIEALKASLRNHLGSVEVTVSSETGKPETLRTIKEHYDPVIDMITSQNFKETADPDQDTERLEL